MNGNGVTVAKIVERKYGDDSYLSLVGCLCCENKVSDERGVWMRARIRSALTALAMVRTALSSPDADLVLDCISEHVEVAEVLLQVVLANDGAHSM